MSDNLERPDRSRETIIVSREIGLIRNIISAPRVTAGLSLSKLRFGERDIYVYLVNEVRMLKKFINNSLVLTRQNVIDGLSGHARASIEVGKKRESEIRQDIHTLIRPLLLITDEAERLGSSQIELDLVARDIEDQVGQEIDVHRTLLYEPSSEDGKKAVRLGYRAWKKLANHYGADYAVENNDFVPMTVRLAMMSPFLDAGKRVSTSYREPLVSTGDIKEVLEEIIREAAKQGRDPDEKAKFARREYELADSAVTDLLLCTGLDEMRILVMKDRMLRDLRVNFQF